MSVLLATLATGVLALPAAAQSVPNVPGADTIRRAIQDQIARVARQAGLPASAATALANAAANPPSPPPLAQPAVNLNQPQAGDEDRPAARTRPARRSLPSTGMPVAAIGLLGVALVSGGRLLVEMTAPWRRG